MMILGLVQWMQPVHGYDVRRELLSWNADKWANVQPGSIYHALKQLTKEGKLRAVGTEESDEGPGRTLYELTQEGVAEFHELIEAALSSFQLEELGAGVAFMQTLPRQHVVNLLREQHRRATETRDGLEKMMPAFPRRDGPPHTQDLLSLWCGGLAATASWTERLIQRLEGGEYVMAGEGCAGNGLP